MNILFICPYTPTLIRTRSFNFLRTLVKRGHTVILATLWENDNECAALHELRTLGIQVIAEPLSRARRGANLLRAAVIGKPLQSLYSWSPALAHRIAHEVVKRASRLEVIHVEHLRGAEYGLQIKTRTLPVIWDSVDCISYLFEQAARVSRNPFGRFVTRLELPRTRRYEAQLLEHFAQVLVTSSLDQAALESLARAFATSPVQPIQVVPNGVDLDYFQPRQCAREPRTIVLTGKMSYHANATAAVYLVNQVMPRVWRFEPDVCVKIVGRHPTRAVRALADADPQRVQVTGAVADIRPYLATATMAVAPILYGAGIQNKVLEAMAMATPVVATSKAVSALSVQAGRDLLVGNDSSSMAQGIVELLHDARLREQLGRHGRLYVEQHHDWEKITDQLERVYLSQKK